MSRSTIAKLFYGSLAAIVLGIILIAIAVGVLVASSALVMDGPDVVGVRPAFGWGMFVLAAVAILLFTAGGIAQFVAWIGALIETAPLDDKTWFVVLLVTGILGFGVITLLVYLLAEPGPPRAGSTVASTPAAV